MHRNVKSIVKGIAVGIGDTGLIHDLPWSSLTFAEGLSAALRPPEAMTVPDHEAISVYDLADARHETVRISVNQYTNSGIATFSHAPRIRRTDKVAAPFSRLQKHSSLAKPRQRNAPNKGEVS